MASTTDVKCRLKLFSFWWLGLLRHEGRGGGKELKLPTHTATTFLKNTRLMRIRLLRDLTLVKYF